MKLRRPKVGGRYVAWMRGAFRGGQGRLGAPETAGRPCSQPQARGRDSARAAAKGCHPVTGGAQAA